MPPTTQPKPSSNPSTALALRTTPAKKRLRLNAFGVRLFGTIVGGALLSMAGVVFLFSETVKTQAEEQIQKILAGKVSTIDEVTDRAETLADSLGISVATLHDRRAETPETYQELTRKLFEQHPDYIVGLGFGQKENGILPNQQWFYPYYQTPDAQTPDAQTPESIPSNASTPSARYIDRAAQPYFYPQTETYRRYFLSQESLWTSPYQISNETSPETESNLRLTYYSQIFDNNNEWIGTAVVDIDGNYLSETIAGPIYRQGGQLILASEAGDIIANPANTENIADQTFADIPGLSEIWSQINAQTNTQASGLIEGESGYWSYTRIPEQSWLVLAYVPYRVVFGQILLIALSAILPAGALMAGLTYLVIRYLNQRLRPVIDECQRLSTANGAVAAQLSGKDELEQLSISFFNLLEQLKLSQTQVQLEAAHATEIENQLNTIKNRSAVAKHAAPPVHQKELAQLNQVISELAESSGSELTPAGNRLHQTFSQVLTALNQFSQLLTAVSQTQGRVLSMEDVMLTANQDMQTQADLIHQLQQDLTDFYPLTETLTQGVNQLAEQANSPRVIRPHALTVAHPALTTLPATSQKLTEQLNAIARATDSIHYKTKEYRNIASTARVLITNASTLAISASRAHSPETLEEIVTQLRDKDSALKALVERLESAQSEQQQSSTDAKALSADLSAGIYSFERTVRKINDEIQSMAKQSMATDQAHERNTDVKIQAAKSQAIAANQQLIDKIQALHETLKQIEALTIRETEQIALTLQQTRQLSQMSFPKR